MNIEIMCKVEPIGFTLNGARQLIVVQDYTDVVSIYPNNELLCIERTHEDGPVEIKLDTVICIKVKK